MSSQPEILNLGSGSAKITGALNVDSSLECYPDLVASLKEPLPFEDNRFNKVLLFHCIEHIEKRLQPLVLSEIWRVLKPGGIFLCSYPEFSKIVTNWLENKKSDRDFWEKTIYGRQLYPGDYHVTVMDTPTFKETLFEYGFDVFEIFPEPRQDFNTVIKARKVDKPKTYEQVLYEDVFQ